MVTRQVAPPVAQLQIVNPGGPAAGHFTPTGLNMYQQLWSAITGAQSAITALLGSGGDADNPFVVQSWTPVLQGGGTAGSQGYATQSGKYLALGPLVIAEFNVKLSALDTATDGAVQISGLPSPASSLGVVILGRWGDLTLPGGGTQLGGTVQSGSSAATVYVSSSGDGSASLKATQLTDTTELTGFALYFQ